MKYAFLMVAGALAVFSACDKKDAPAAEAAKIGPASAAPEFAAPDTFHSALEKVFDGYIGIQSALAQDDLAKAKAALSPMHALLHTIPKDGLDSGAKVFWDSADARFMDALHPMAASENLDSVRSHFVAFSEAFIDVFEKFGPAADGPVYRFHCPMAQNNRGADWLQRERELANPYFGKSMLRCGSIVQDWNT